MKISSQSPWTKLMEEEEEENTPNHFRRVRLTGWQGNIARIKDPSLYMFGLIREASQQLIRQDYVHLMLENTSWSTLDVDLRLQATYSPNNDAEVFLSQTLLSCRQRTHGDELLDLLVTAVPEDPWLAIRTAFMHLRKMYTQLGNGSCLMLTKDVMISIRDKYRPMSYDSHYNKHTWTQQFSADLPKTKQQLQQ